MKIDTPDATPKLWRDMTPEEKGALLLAHHEGRVIEVWRYDDKWVGTEPHWNGFNFYRVKPAPPREFWLGNSLFAYASLDAALDEVNGDASRIIHVREVLE